MNVVRLQSLVRLLIFAFLLVGIRQPVIAQDATFFPVEILVEQIETLPTRDVESFLERLGPEVREQIPEFNLRSLVTDPTGAFAFDFRSALSWVGNRLVHEVVTSSQLLIQLILLAVVSALLKNVADSLGGKEVTEIAFMVSLVALILLGVQAFRTVVAVADTAITDMVGFMHAVLPLMAALLVAVGGVTTATIFHPVLLSVVIGVGTLVRGLLLPLAFAGVVFTLVSKLAHDVPIGRLSGLIKQWSTTILSFMFVLFLGIVSIRGAIGPVIDGLGVKTAKFLTGTFVPVIGGRLADALDVVVSGSLLIKNAVGAFGMLVVFVITALPVLKLFALLIVFRLAAVFVEPITEDRLVSAIASMGDGVALVLSCVLTVSLMFFIAVTALVALGNVTVVMR